MNTLSIELINLLINYIILGFIWIVALTHYPIFRYIDPNKWHEAQKHHSQSISLIIMPLMLAELGLAIYFVWKYPSSSQWLLSIILVIAIWLNTFLQAVPLHKRLANGKNMKLINNLITINWIRTVLWTGKAVLLMYFFVRT